MARDPFLQAIDAAAKAGRETGYENGATDMRERAAKLAEKLAWTTVHGRDIGDAIRALPLNSDQEIGLSDDG